MTHYLVDVQLIAGMANLCSRATNECEYQFAYLIPWSSYHIRKAFWGWLQWLHQRVQCLKRPLCILFVRDRKESWEKLNGKRRVLSIPRYIYSFPPTIMQFFQTPRITVFISRVWSETDWLYIARQSVSYHLPFKQSKSWEWHDKMWHDDERKAHFPHCMEAADENRVIAVQNKSATKL